MIEILNTLVSLDLFRVMFCCDLERCGGLCCVEGDAGAPVAMEEVELLEEAAETEAVRCGMTKEALERIEAEGVVYPDRDGELVTQIVDGKDCVFAGHGALEGVKRECAFCAIEAAFRQGKFRWRKPISCALYPVRLSTVGGMTAVNVHKWDICQPARQLGQKLGLPVFRFLKEPLVQRFGQAWWDECDLAAKELKKAGYL